MFRKLLENAPLLAALYGRYSSDNQKTTSIEDQFSVCRRYAGQQKIVVLRASCKNRDRPGFPY